MLLQSQLQDSAQQQQLVTPGSLPQLQQQLLPSESSLSCALRRSLPSPVGFVDVCGVALPCDARWAGPPSTTTSTATKSTTSSSSGKRKSAQTQPSYDSDADVDTDSGAVTYVATPSVQRSLRAVALALAQQRPLLLEGPPGCGKSALLDELARMTHRDDVIHIHLDDQMDSKGLLGAYVCSAVPGEFVWQPGPLTQVGQDTLCRPTCKEYITGGGAACMVVSRGTHLLSMHEPRMVPPRSQLEAGVKSVAADVMVVHI